MKATTLRFLIPPWIKLNPMTALHVSCVFSVKDAKPQQWMSPPLYLVTWMALLTILIYLPTHLLLERLCPTHKQAAAKLRA